MREIVFRGKPIIDVDDDGNYILNDFEYGSLCQDFRNDIFEIRTNELPDENSYNEYIEFEVAPETIGQFTGLLDKNGKKIFEGDIIQFTREQGYHTARKGSKHIVKYYSYSYCGYGINENSGLTAKKSKECIVIGNIHDNPELMEQKFLDMPLAELGEETIKIMLGVVE